MPDYKKHYVAYLDILGFKSLLNELSCDDIYSIFDVLHTRTQVNMSVNCVDINAFDHIQYKILSDSIVIYIESDIDDAFAALTYICRLLQVSLANRKDPILLRGGISIGDLFYENDIIFGEGLVKAYMLEANIAKYPRIVFTGNTLAIGYKNINNMFVDMTAKNPEYRMDEDALYYLDYLIEPYIEHNCYIPYLERLRVKCDMLLNQAIENGVREKYLWLRKKIIEAITFHPNVVEYLEHILNEKETQLSKEYEKYYFQPLNDEMKTSEE